MRGPGAPFGRVIRFVAHVVGGSGCAFGHVILRQIGAAALGTTANTITDKAILVRALERFAIGLIAAGMIDGAGFSGRPACL